MLKELCYVIDLNDQPLSPTSFNKGWCLVRKNKAIIVSRLPFVVKLNRVIENINDNLVICGIDTGARYTGIALVEQCDTKNKVLFKGTINHPQDVKKKMDLRLGQRRYRRSHKRYRKARFNNRKSSKRKGRIPNSIKCNKDEILRVINKISKFLRVDLAIIEDVQIDIRRLVDDKKVYKWQYQKSNKLDNNIRLATLMRDNNKCQMCGKANTILDVHHITPRRLQGSDTLNNLISLCRYCHSEVTGKEMDYADRLYKKIGGKNVNTKDSMRCMQGKTYLRENLDLLYPTQLTYGSDTANKRQDWDIEKSHANDAICICGLEIKSIDCELKDWIIKPLRANKKSKIEEVCGFRHRDYIKYTRKDKTSILGYIIALDEIKKTFSFVGEDGKDYRRYGLSRCKLIQRPKSINFL